MYILNALKHPDKPIYLFQGIWLDEIEDPSNNKEWDLFNHTSNFENTIEEVVDCLHGNKSIEERLGKAYGVYQTDVSRWVMGYIIGREMSPDEIDSTNFHNSQLKTFNGNIFSISNATPSEVWITARANKVVSYEKEFYGFERPVSFSNWPTLDPLKHITEDSEEDRSWFDLNNIDLTNSKAGYFATYHAYPYFPNFVNEDTVYLKEVDDIGINPYFGYLKDLKNHYSNIPLLIGEFGVPSSWGNAHSSKSGMPHGGLTEEQQGNFNIRMLHNIEDARCGGGMMFAWMDEWFKPTWIVYYLESIGLVSGAYFIPTRQLWHNLCSPEQNFGLISFDSADSPLYETYQLDRSDIVTEIQSGIDDQFFYLSVTLPTDIKSDDTIIIGFDTYNKDIGELFLPGYKQVTNRAEFCLEIPFKMDTANFYVTQAYNLEGLTPRFFTADTMLQKFKSVISNAQPWNLMKWITEIKEKTAFNIGKVKIKNSLDNGSGENLNCVFWSQNKFKVRIPWTMLYFSDPTQLEVVNGFKMLNNDIRWAPYRAYSDGIAISIAKGNDVVNTTNRYKWPSWLVVHPTVERDKASLSIVKQGLSEIPDVP